MKRVVGQVIMWPHEQSSDVGSAGMAGTPVLEGGNGRKWGSLGFLTSKDITSPFHSPVEFHLYRMQ